MRYIHRYKYDTLHYLIKRAKFATLTTKYFASAFAENHVLFVRRVLVDPEK